MKILMLGGTPRLKGGVDEFCKRSMAAFAKLTGHRIERIPTESAYLNLSRMPAYLKGIGKLISHRGKDIDVVWLQYVSLADLAHLVVAKALGMKVLVTPHLGKNWRSQSNPLLRGISRRLLELADGMAPISRTQELEIPFPRGVPRSYVRNFLPLRIFSVKPPLLEEAPPVMQLIHSGRLSEGKGTFLFVDVCHRLKQQGVPFQARITGGADDATYAALDAKIREYGLESEVSVLGRVSDEEILDLLLKTDFLIHLSKIDSYPLIVLEATICGAFPVCYDLAGAADMIRTYDGFVVGDDQIVSRTADFLAGQDLDDIRRRSRAAAARVHADYDWKICVQLAEQALVRTRDRSFPEAAPATS